MKAECGPAFRENHVARGRGVGGHGFLGFALVLKLGVYNYLYPSLPLTRYEMRCARCSWQRPINTSACFWRSQKNWGGYYSESLTRALTFHLLPNCQHTAHYKTQTQNKCTNREHLLQSFFSKALSMLDHKAAMRGTLFRHCELLSTRSASEDWSC